MHRRMLSYFFALAVATGAYLAHADTCTATNVVVAPLTGAHWVQGAPYNMYTPHSSWQCGCEAISSSQEFLVWKWPWRLGAIHTASHFVNGEDDSVIRFDGSVPFDWDSMLDSYGSGATLKQKHEAARLSLMCQSLLQMQYVSGGGDAKKQIPGTMEWYEYVGSVKPNENGGDDEAVAAIRADFEFGSPTQVGVPQHAVVGLGYATGTNSVGTAVDLIWLNYGWGGGSDGWYDLRSTEHYADSGLLYTASPLQNVHVGFRPIKSVQIEPIAPISASDVTIKWHLPNCYTNKIDGFSVAKKKISESLTNWTDDFAVSDGRSSNTNVMRIRNGQLYAWSGQGTTGIYTWDNVFVPTKDTELTYDAVSCYMSSMEARFEVKVNGVWDTIAKLPLSGNIDDLVENGATVSLSDFADNPIQLRFVVEYTKGGVYQHDVANIHIDNVSISNVKTFETVSTDDTIAASARSATFSDLATSETYAFSVTPIMSDGSAAVMQTVATTIGKPAASPVIGAVTMTPKGENLVQEGFYADIAMGWNVIDVACQNAATLEAFISHQSVLPQNKVEVVDNRDGSFSINIDANEVASKWANQKMILTLKATNATGETAYKDLELCLKASGVPEKVPGGKVWTGGSALYGANDYTAKWTDNVLPVDDDKVTFLTTDAEFGGEMNLNLSTPTTLGYVLATGDGQLTISGTSSEMLTADVLKNDIQVEINSSKFKVNKAVPSANIVIDGGSSLVCEIDQSRSSYIKKVSGGHVSALNDSSLWKGTVVFSGYTAAGLNFNNYGNAASSVRLNGVSGYLDYSSPTFNPVVELVDSGTTPALNWSDGSGGSTATFKALAGDGTFKTGGTGGTAEKIILNDIDGFTGSLNLASKTVAIGTAVGTTASNGRLNVNSGYGATIAGGKTWTIGGGVYLAGNQTLTVNGTLSDSGVLAAEGTGTTLALAPTGSVTAASLSFANNTIRLSMTQDASPTLAVTGAADLAGATIDVDRASGMPVENSITLMTAGSFEGVDTATIRGLDGYSLEADGGTLYAVKDEPIYDGPAPTAVWVSGEFEDAANKHNGYSIVLPSSGISVSGGKLVVASNATTGATIDLTSTNVNKVTVLIEYSSLAAVSGKNVTLATVKDSESHVIGARTTANGVLTLTGYFDASSDNNYAFGTVPTLPSGTGYLMLTYDDTTDDSGNGTYCYAGDSIDALVGGRNSGLKWTGNSRKINVVSIGGPITANRVEAWSGVKIEKVALFVGEALTSADIAYYKFPEVQEPEEPEEPTVVARLVVNSATVGTYATLDEALNALAMQLYLNPTADVYVEVVDDELETPNKYGASNIGYSAAERKYARAVTKLDNGTGTYPAFLNLADAWTAAGKGADTATITILAAPSDSVTIEVGQTLKVEGLTLADDKVRVGENRIKCTTTDDSVTTYTAKYTDVVTLLDGTIYHGNDENRAVITNYLSQMVGHRPVKMPAPNTVDLLLVYDTNAVNYALEHYATVEEHAAYSVAEMNRALTTTDIDTNVWFRIAGIYPITNAVESVDAAMELGKEGVAPGWELVHEVRDNVGADVVLSVVMTNCNYGLAYRCDPTGIKNKTEASWAYAGVRADAPWAWVHETGHLASLYHNIEEAKNNYIGCGFVKTAEADVAELRSLMDSGTAQFAFSSPNHKSHGEVYSVTNSIGNWVDASGVLAELLPYMAKYRDTVVNAWTITPQSGSTVASGDTMTVTCEDPEATIWYSRYGEDDSQYEGPVAINTSASWCIYNVTIKKGDETVGTTQVTYTVDQSQVDSVAKIDGGNGYDTLQGAIDAAESGATIILLKSSSEAITLNKTIVFSEGENATFSGTFTGSGTLKLGAFLKNSKTPSGVSPLAAGWTGTVELTFAFAASGQATPLARYGNANSTLKLTGDMTGGWLANVALDTTIELEGNMTLSDFSTSFANTIRKLTGTGTFSITYSSSPDLQYSGYYPYYLIKDISGFEGSLVIPENGTIGIVVGANSKPSDKSHGGKILVYGAATAHANWTAPGGIVLADAEATLTVVDGAAVTVNPAISTTVADSYVKVTAVEGGTRYEVRLLADRATNTDYPVPYSWFSIYAPGITDDYVEQFAKMPASNGQNTWWQCYVLGLDPTNETSKFETTIKMVNGSPVVEYSPTNTTLPTLQYILQGKPLLNNYWQDVEFDDPGDTNRFFRVKVEW